MRVRVNITTAVMLSCNAMYSGNIHRLSVFPQNCNHMFLPNVLFFPAALPSCLETARLHSLRFELFCSDMKPGLRI